MKQETKSNDATLGLRNKLKNKLLSVCLNGTESNAFNYIVSDACF